MAQVAPKVKKIRIIFQTDALPDGALALQGGSSRLYCVLGQVFETWHAFSCRHGQGFAMMSAFFSATVGLSADALGCSPAEDARSRDGTPRTT